MIKQALIVRKDLPMSVGKLIAQAAHGAVSTALDADPPDVRRWSETGMTKIVLTVPGEDDLRRLAKAALAAGLPYALVVDEGRTELEPHTVTCLAIGPGEIDSITGQLPLLREWPERRPIE